MRQERGAASLAEILVTIAIVGIAFSAILGGFAGMIVGTRLHRDRTEAQLVLDNAAEAIRSTAVSYLQCATPAQYDAALATAGTVTVPAGWSASADVTVAAVRFWDGEDFGPLGAGANTCDTSADSLLRLQLVTIEVDAPGSAVTESISVVKAP